MTTPLYPVFQKRIYDATELLIQNQVTPWAFLNSGKPMRVKTFYGKQISYEVPGFEGSPREVFWHGYMDPFLEAMAVRELSAAVAMAKERDVDAKQLLPEVQELLNVACTRIFAHMADIDRRLRGKGFPDTVHVRPIERELARLKDFTAVRVASELALWKPQSNFQKWVNQSVLSVVGTVLTIAGIVVAVLGLFL